MTSLVKRGVCSTCGAVVETGDGHHHSDPWDIVPAPVTPAADQGARGAAWTCRQHGTTQPDDKTYCPACMDQFKSRRDAATMTVEERITELQQWMGQLTIPFNDVHERVTELMGRDVWTHEIAYADLLYAELRNGETVGIAEVIAKLPADKPVIVIEVPS